MVGGKHAVHMGVAPADPLHHLLLTGHTAAEKDLLPGMAALGVGQRPQIAEYPLLRVLPDGTGVHHHHVRALRFLADSIAGSHQHSPDPLGIRFVLLAAVGLHIGLRHRAPLHPAPADPVAEPLLRLQFFL